MITDSGLWTIVINLIIIAFAVQYSRSESFGEALVWWIWDFSGLRFVWEKIRPPTLSKPSDYRPPSTFSAWVFGILSIYAALFYYVQEQYDKKSTKVEKRVDDFYKSIALSKSTPDKALWVEIAMIQQMRIPLEPDFFRPLSVINSIRNTKKPENANKRLLTLIKSKKEFLAGAELEFANLQGAELSSANLAGAYLLETDFKMANLEGANLKDAKCFQAEMENTNLTAAILESAYLNKASLKGAFLSKSDLSGAILRGAFLNEADLRHAKLTGADLRFANLKDAFLTNADLQEVKFIGVELKGADLTGANLKDAVDLSIVALCTAGSLKGAKMDQTIKAQVQMQCPEVLNRNLYNPAFDFEDQL